jgi:hypothetical protein
MALPEYCKVGGQNDRHRTAEGPYETGLQHMYVNSRMLFRGAFTWVFRLATQPMY